MNESTYSPILTRPTMRRAKRIIAGIVVLAAVAAHPALAQTTDTIPPPDRWKFGSDLALTATSGNQSFAILTAGLQLKHLQVESYEFELDTQARYGRSEGEDIARKLQGSMKFDFHPEAVWSPFFFVQAEHDRFRSLSLRLQGGAGAKYTFWSEGDDEVSLSLAALYDRERLDDEPASERARWSWRGRLDKELATDLRFSNTTFYQPVWDRAADYLITSRTALSTRVTDHVALNITHLFERDSTPPEDVRKSDQTFTVGLRIEL